MKQTLETIMVFQKETKNKSVLDDVFAFEEGDDEISPSIWNIDNGRVPTEDKIENHSRGPESAKSKGSYGDSKEQKTHQTEGQKLGRYPSQLFVDENVAEDLDNQSGVLTTGATPPRNTDEIHNSLSGIYGKRAKKREGNYESNTGGSSKILHKIKYLNDDLDDVFMHEEKTKENVKKAETLGRYPSQLFVDENVAEDLDNQSGILTSGEKKPVKNNSINSVVNNGKGFMTSEYNTSSMESNKGGSSKILHKIKYLNDDLDLAIYCPKVPSSERNAGLEKNNHPTLKPIKLIYKIAELLKSPNLQNVFFPFAGSGSEIIGFMKAGFDLDKMEISEISEEYVEIAEVRIEAWKNIDIEKYIKKNTMEIEKDEFSDDEW